MFSISRRLAVFCLPLAFDQIRRMSTPATVPLLLRLVSETVSIVNVAGSIVRKVLDKGNLGVIDKGINDLQTRADRAAQLYIVSNLAKQFPKASIIGEESDESLAEDKDLESLISSANAEGTDQFPEILTKDVSDEIKSISEEDIVIWVDPLDGTAEFTQGLVEHVTVLVGITVNGSPVAGVVHQPFFKTTGRTIWGIPGTGCGGMEFKKPPTGKRIITTTRSHPSARVEAAINALEPTEVLRVGGSGHKVMLLLEGKAHAYVYASAGCKKWDSCGPEAILVAAGGKLTDMSGELYQYHKTVEHLNKDGILATAAGEDPNWYLQRLGSK